VAVDDVSLEIAPGRIHAVCGENGAGKSTLLKMVAGVLVPDSGTVRVDGAVLSPHRADEALRRGVAMVQQHFALVPEMTAVENCLLMDAFVLRPDAMRARLRDAMAALGFEVPTDVPVERLGVGEKQRVEIARTLTRRAQVLILDEPTAVLTPQEATELYEALERLRSQGRAIVVVTHKLDEIERYADEVTVLRRGKLVLAGPRVRGASTAEITAAIMGDGHRVTASSLAEPSATVVLTLRHLARAPSLRDVSLELRAGEIVGLAGVEGNGQRELTEVLAGLDAADAGEVVAVGPIAVVHEDRQTEGLVLTASLADNVFLGRLGQVSAHGLVNLTRFRAEAGTRLARVDPALEESTVAGSLSGGNQQKVVIARALADIATAGARVLLAAHPTRGVDIGAAAVIHERIRDAAKAGAGVLLISADLDELRRLCHRILVISRGEIAGVFDGSATDAAIGEKMLRRRAAS
jgi:simple sugar transport system ATP-binding protein